MPRGVGGMAGAFVVLACMCRGRMQHRLPQNHKGHLLKGEHEIALVRVLLRVLDSGQTQVKDLFAVLAFEYQFIAPDLDLASIPTLHVQGRFRQLGAQRFITVLCSVGADASATPRAVTIPADDWCWRVR